MADTDKPQKINIGFLGGPVLSARVAPAELAKLRAALEGGGWHDLEAQESTVALDLLEDRLRARRQRGSPGRLRRLSRPRRRGRRPVRPTVRQPCPRRPLTAGCCSRPHPRPRPAARADRRDVLAHRRARGVLAGARRGRGARRPARRAPRAGCAASASSPSPTPSTTRVKLAVRRPPAGRSTGLPPLSPTVSQAVLPQRARHDLVRGRPCLPGTGARRPPVRRRDGVRDQPARTSASTIPPTCSPERVLGTGLGAPHADEGRHRGDAQRRQVLAVHRAHRRRRRGGQLSVHDDRAQRRDRAGGRRAARRRSPASSAPRRSCPTRSPSTTSPASSPGPTAARGWATSSWPTSARPTRSSTSSAPTPTRTSSIPRAASIRCTTSRRSRPSCVYADLEQAERRVDRVAKTAKSGDRHAIAEERWLREVIEALSAGRPARTVPPPNDAAGCR